VTSSKRGTKRNTGRLGTCIARQRSGLGMPWGAAAPKPPAPSCCWRAGGGRVLQTDCCCDTGTDRARLTEPIQNVKTTVPRCRSSPGARLGPVCCGLVECGTVTEGRTRAPVEKASTIVCPRTWLEEQPCPMRSHQPPCLAGSTAAQPRPWGKAKPLL